MGGERLDRQRVIDAAVALLDTEGLEALSTRRLGAVLKTSANAMYWHVGSKENLVGLATDAVFADLTLTTDGDSWRDRLAATARELRTMFTRHAWLTAAFGSYPDIHGPAIVRFQDHVLEVCEQAGFVGFDLDWAGATVFSFVIGDAGGQIQPSGAGDTPASTDELLEQARSTLAGHPRVLARFTALAQADPAAVAEASFEFGLRSILDGLQARIAQPEAGRLTESQSGAARGLRLPTRDTPT